MICCNWRTKKRLPQSIACRMLPMTMFHNSSTPPRIILMEDTVISLASLKIVRMKHRHDSVNRRTVPKNIMLNPSSIDTAYNEITTWRKNTFLVPYGKTGRNFIEQFTKHFNDWNNKTEMQHIALKEAVVLLALGLQKPSRQSKAIDHQECLSRRLPLWKRISLKF